MLVVSRPSRRVESHPWSCVPPQLGNDPLAARSRSDERNRLPTGQLEGLRTNPAAARDAADVLDPSHLCLFSEPQPTDQVDSRPQSCVVVVPGNDPFAPRTLSGERNRLPTE